VNKLSARAVANAKTPGLYGDGGGLYLQVSATGTRSWLFRYKVGGRSRCLGPEDHIWSIDLVHNLINLEDRSWGSWGRIGKPITQERVAALLRGFKIMPKQIKHGGINRRGYLAAPFYAAFERYLIPAAEGSGA
jgi:hypothetical protein